jgi:AcrR family transcriptional regulator
LKKKIQMNRMLQYFIDATAEIIEKEGVESVTIRKVADIAGYNSATIYNYFGELSHLVFFASMKFLKDYTNDLSVYMARGKSALDKCLLAWECFCNHSFKNPKLFHAIYLSNLGEQPQELIQRYYSLYQSDLIDLPEELKPIVIEANLWKRNETFLQRCVDEGSIKKENLEKISEMTMLIWQGMLTTLLNNRGNYTNEEATKKTLSFVKEIIIKN